MPASPIHPDKYIINEMGVELKDSLFCIQDVFCTQPLRVLGEKHEGAGGKTRLKSRIDGAILKNLN